MKKLAIALTVLSLGFISMPASAGMLVTKYYDGCGTLIRVEKVRAERVCNVVPVCRDRCSTCGPCGRGGYRWGWW